MDLVNGEQREKNNTVALGTVPGTFALLNDGGTL